MDCLAIGFRHVRRIFFRGGLTILECPPSQKKSYSRLVKIVQPASPLQVFQSLQGGIDPPFPPLCGRR